MLITVCPGSRRRIVQIAMSAKIDPISALAFIQPETTAGQLKALQVLAAEQRKQHER